MSKRSIVKHRIWSSSLKDKHHVNFYGSSVLDVDFENFCFSWCILGTSCDSAIYFPLSSKTSLLTFNEYCSWSLFQYITSVIHFWCIHDTYMVHSFEAWTKTTPWFWKFSHEAYSFVYQLQLWWCVCHLPDKYLQIFQILFVCLITRTRLIS